MPNLKALMYKLQRALVVNGRVITINQVQMYNEATEKMLTKYRLRENENCIFESWQIIYVVKFLAGELSGGGG